ncbi:MAG: hypothetical protein ABI251_16460 [Mycobacteriaceae bacterium]
MALREELSKLDSEVAAGQITVEEFRSQRDRLLAEAGSGPATSAPFPPPYRWEEPAAADDHTRVVPRPAPAEDRTQVVRQPATSAGERTPAVRRQPEPSTTPSPEDRTQVVHRPAHRRATPQPADADHTQVVRGGGVASGYANVGAPPWARGAALLPTPSSPPRPEGTLPPWTLNQPTPAVQRSTGYVDAATFRAHRSRRWWVPAAAFVVVLLIVALIVLLAW